MPMTSSRPYLIRALYEWITDNRCTPYILVDATARDVSVPRDYVNPDGQIVLNVSPSAVVDFMIDDSKLSFRARFGGVPTDIFVPSDAIMGIYAKENQQGMIFGHPESSGFDPDDPSPGGKKDLKDKPELPKSRPSLKVVK